MLLVSKFEDTQHKQPVALAIGNFDGVHLGHQMLLDKTKEFAAEMSLTPAVCTFSPHPVRFYKRDIDLICTEAEKYRLLEKYGIEICFVVPFTDEFASLAPEEFVQEYIISRMNAKAVVVGDDYNFGRNRSGNAALLKELCEKRGVRCEVIRQKEAGGQPISSSRIRKEILAGNYEYLPALLGRYMEYGGVVEHGDKIGIKLGFPTANISPVNEALPPHGVYAGYTELDGKRYAAMISMGTRPTVTNNGAPRFEAHIIGFSGDLYGREIYVSIVEKLRDNVKFASLDELKNQLALDQERTLESLSRHKILL